MLDALTVEQTAWFDHVGEVISILDRLADEGQSIAIPALKMHCTIRMRGEDGAPSRRDGADCHARQRCTPLHDPAVQIRSMTY